MTLTKREVVIHISEETGLVQSQVADMVQMILDYIAAALAKGDRVELRNFGVFEVTVRKARIGRNPQDPEKKVIIPSRAMVKFQAGKEMRSQVLKLSPQPDRHDERAQMLKHPKVADLGVVFGPEISHRPPAT